MRALVADQLGVSFALPLFAGAGFHLGPGWTGVVGPNGAGKSTLLDVLAGARPPTEGRVRREPPDARVARCAQGVDALPDGVEDLLGDDRAARRLRGRLGLDPDALARWPTLSPGERRRWQIGAALLAEPDVLLLDEPTNHLDAEARARLIDALAGFRGVGVVVSHDRALLDAVCAQILRVVPGAPGRIEAWPGGYTTARAAWEAEAEARRGRVRRAQEDERQARARLADARREAGAADRARSAGARMKDRHDHDARGMGAQFRADRASARLGRAVAERQAGLGRAQEAREAEAWEEELGRALTLGGAAPPVRWLATVERLGAGGGEARRLDVPLSVGRGDRVWVRGPNGAGKSTLMAALREGLRVPPERVLWLPQELDPAEATRGLAALRALPGPERDRVLRVVAALGVDPARLLATAAPSPGEARKLALALGLGGQAWLALLDEPTNHLDLPSVERLQAALAGWPGALVLVTHDEALAAATTQVTWRVDGGAVVVE